MVMYEKNEDKVLVKIVNAKIREIIGNALEKLGKKAFNGKIRIYGGE